MKVENIFIINSWIFMLNYSIIINNWKLSVNDFNYNTIIYLHF